MRHVLRTSILLILGLLVIILVFYLTTQAKTDILEMFGFSGFEITEKTESNIGDIHFTRFIANNGTIILKVEHAKDVDTAKAKQYIDEKRFGIESLYQSIPSPYPDVVTRTIECPEKFKPIFDITDQDSQDSFYYILYANDRFTYGVCSDDLIKYRAIFYLVYCEQKKEIYQIELFTALEELTDDLVDMLHSLKC